MDDEHLHVAIMVQYGSSEADWTKTPVFLHCLELLNAPMKRQISKVFFPPMQNCSSSFFLSFFLSFDKHIKKIEKIKRNVVMNW